MLNLLPEEKDELEKMTAFALARFEEGTELETILRDIYLEKMEIKSPEHAQIMAKDIISTIDFLYKKYEEISEAIDCSPEENLSGVLEEFTDFEFRGFSEQQKKQLLSAVTGVLENIEKIKVGEAPDEEALKKLTAEFSEKELDEALAETVSAMKDPKVLKSFLENIEDQSLESKQKRMSVVREQDSKTMIAIQTMILYAMIKTNSLKSLPQDISLTQLAVAVCTDSFINNLAFSIKMKTQNENGAGKILAFWLIAIVAVVAMSLLTLACFAAADIVFSALSLFLGIITTAFAAGSIIALDYIFFNDCMNCDVFDFSKIRFNSSKQEFNISDYKLVEVEDAEEETENSSLLKIDEEKLYESLWNDTLPI